MKKQSERLSSGVRVRLTEQQSAWLKHIAQQINLTEADLVRHAIIRFAAEIQRTGHVGFAVATDGTFPFAQADGSPIAIPCGGSSSVAASGAGVAVGGNGSHTVTVSHSASRRRRRDS
jgi:hypothetical protein